MANYWVSIRIKNDAGYTDRYNGFVEALKLAKKSGFWSEPTSFWFIESNLEIDGFMTILSEPLAANKDILVVRKIAVDEARYFGAIEHVDVLVSFMPSAKKFE
jgi:hypothetical protein